MPENGTAAKEHAGRVRDMFASIATRYDLLNHLLSGNVDKRWRRMVAREVGSRLTDNPSILDVACGTGDLSAELFEKTGARVVAVDFCRPMLQIAAGKVGSEVMLIEGDALTLPFPEQSFDAVTIAFGLRNLSSVAGGLKEFYRVLRPRGCVAILEFSKPSNVLTRTFFGFYFTRLLPLLGGIVSGSKSAYTYLPASVERFPDQNELSSLIRQAGFDQVSFKNLTGGIAAFHLGKRP